MPVVHGSERRRSSFWSWLRRQRLGAAGGPFLRGGIVALLSVCPRSIMSFLCLNSRKWVDYKTLLTFQARLGCSGFLQVQGTYSSAAAPLPRRIQEHVPLRQLAIEIEIFEALSKTNPFLHFIIIKSILGNK
jgi:hypothetical protein